jgi:hypothetical protein
LIRTLLKNIDIRGAAEYRAPAVLKKAVTPEPAEIPAYSPKSALWQHFFQDAFAGEVNIER